MSLKINIVSEYDVKHSLIAHNMQTSISGSKKLLKLDTISRVKSPKVLVMCNRKQIEKSSEQTFSRKKNDQEVIGSTIIGLGMWRLRPIIQTKMSTIVARIEGIIRQCCMDDDLDVGDCMGYEYLDTEDPTGRKAEIDPFLSATVTHTINNDHKHPRLQIENRIFSSRVFRKIHIGIASKHDGQQILHLFIFPRPQYYLPILWANVEINQNGTFSAIVDTSSVRKDNLLSEFLMNEVKSMQGCFTDSSHLPQWGRNIFSPLCMSVKLTEISEIDDFIDYICSLLRLQLEIARFMKPIPWDETLKIKEIIGCHYRFCDAHLQNEEIRRFLASSFGEIKTEKYLREFVFDVTKYT